MAGQLMLMACILSTPGFLHSLSAIYTKIRFVLLWVFCVRPDTMGFGVVKEAAVRISSQLQVFDHQSYILKFNCPPFTVSIFIHLSREVSVKQ